MLIRTASGQTVAIDLFDHITVRYPLFFEGCTLQLIIYPQYPFFSWDPDPWFCIPWNSRLNCKTFRIKAGESKGHLPPIKLELVHFGEDPQKKEERRRKVNVVSELLSKESEQKEVLSSLTHKTYDPNPLISLSHLLTEIFLLSGSKEAQRSYSESWWAAFQTNFRSPELSRSLWILRIGYWLWVGTCSIEVRSNYRNE